MKAIHLKQITLYIFLLICSLASAQDSKYNVKASVIFTRFINVEEKDFTPVPGYYKSAVSPGLEIVISRQIMKGFAIGTGINYQYGKVSSFINEQQKRFQFSELSIPVLLQKTFLLKNNADFYFTTGVYFGKMISVKDDYYTSLGWEKTSDIQNVAYYSNDKNISDLYLDFGYSKPVLPKVDISVSPFFRYRVNTTWLNHHSDKMQYGIKLSASLKL